MTKTALMPWRTCKLTDLGTVERGRSRHRPRNDPSLYGGPYPFFQTGDVKGAGLYLRNSSQTYNERGLAQSRLWAPGTLCITIAANIAESAILAVKGCFPDSVVGFIPDEDKADVLFVKYCLEPLKAGMQSVSRGTTQDNLSLDKLLSFNLRVPHLRVQRRIATVLSAYDELIDNNSRRIAIVEEIARSLYDEWFVRFRFPGHEQVRLKATPSGDVPADWTFPKLGDRVELHYGKALKADDRRPGPYAVYGSSGVIGYHAERLVEGPGIIVGRKGNVGSVYWSDHPFYPIDTVYFVKSEISPYYLFFNLQRQNFLNNDAAVPGLNRKQAYSLPLLTPPGELLYMFEHHCKPMFALKHALNAMNLKLRGARDLLLPMLVSGEIDLGE